MVEKAVNWVCFPICQTTMYNKRNLDSK